MRQGTCPMNISSRGWWRKVSSTDQAHLLTASQMAQFVTDGALVLPEVVPSDLNQAVYEDLLSYDHAGGPFWYRNDHIRKVFEVPAVQGAIRSLVGRNPVYDHSAVHVVGPGNERGQTYHADSIIDARPLAFDIQAFYFCHDTPYEMGPTLILPGSHLRRVNTASIGRLKNFRGQKRMASKAGTIAFLHQGIWHCAQPNQTDRMRYVFKLRLRPGEEQRGLFNLDGYDSAEVRRILYNGYAPWQGDEGRLDHMNRARLWRYVTGDDAVDVSFEGAFARMGI